MITNESSVNLWPSVYGMNPDERDPTAEEFAWVEQFEAEHVRRDDLWA